MASRHSRPKFFASCLTPKRCKLPPTTNPSKVRLPFIRGWVSFTCRSKVCWTLRLKKRDSRKSWRSVKLILPRWNKSSPIRNSFRKCQRRYWPSTKTVRRICKLRRNDCWSRCEASSDFRATNRRALFQPCVSMNLKMAQRCAVKAALSTGKILRRYLASAKRANSITQHDIKLELDVRCQKQIEQTLNRTFPEVGSLGEEGSTGNTDGDYRWVIDPIDGTVNFAYGIPHACVSIALQRRVELKAAPANGDANYQTVLGVIFNPFCEELWTATCNGPARLNGRIIRVSTRTRLAESIITLGFSKSNATLDKMLRGFNRLIHRVRKLRIM